MIKRNPDNVNFPPFETEDLRANLARFLNTPLVQTQAKRLQWLAERRYEALGGAASVEKEGDEDA